MIRLALGHLWYYFPRVSLTFLLKLIGTLGNFKECNEWERHPVMIRPLFGHLWFHPVANHVFNGVPHSCRCGIVFCHSFPLFFLLLQRRQSAYGDTRSDWNGSAELPHHHHLSNMNPIWKFSLMHPSFYYFLTSHLFLGAVILAIICLQHIPSCSS